jgi:hypothetical protein
MTDVESAGRGAPAAGMLRRNAESRFTPQAKTWVMIGREKEKGSPKASFFGIGTATDQKMNL